uniref:Uncharacterized protein n=1 Tax=Steinernema glaseri TaxID=37863 RepID=A0A1I7ZBQ3_9BILA
MVVRQKLPNKHLMACASGNGSPSKGSLEPCQESGTNVAQDARASEREYGRLISIFRRSVSCQDARTFILPPATFNSFFDVDYDVTEQRTEEARRFLPMRDYLCTPINRAIETAASNAVQIIVINKAQSLTIPSVNLPIFWVRKNTLKYRAIT